MIKASDLSGILLFYSHADQTRTYILGKAKEGTKKLFQSLKKIADYLINHIKPGMKCSDSMIVIKVRLMQKFYCCKLWFPSPYTKPYE
jgi:Xaa-Pro aminopeptidase